MTARYLVAPLALATLLLSAAGAFAQSFPAPLPQQSASGSSPFPAVNGAAPSAVIGAPSGLPATGALSGGAPSPGAPMGAPPGASDCERGFLALKGEAEKRGVAIKAASARRAPPDEACKLIGQFSAAEVKMVRFIEANSQKCGIPPQVADQFKAGHKNTETMQKKVCDVAQQVKNRAPAGPSLSEVLGSSNALPEATSTKKAGGSTFDTLSGNVLTR